MVETKDHSAGSNHDSTPLHPHDRRRGHQRLPRRGLERDLSPVVPPSTPRDMGQTQRLALPSRQEFWSLLERYNKAALARRFPDWPAAPSDARSG